MARTIVERVPVELYELARQRSQCVGQSRSQAYRDLASVAGRIPGVMNAPIPSMKEAKKNEPKKKEPKIRWDFRF